MKKSKLYLIIGVFSVFGFGIFFSGHKLARDHVNYMTGVEDHPLECASCHLYTSKNALVSKFINEDYYSPFNLAVSKDGSRLFVVAQEANTILVADPVKRTVINKIKVGKLPHSVIISLDGQKAYVSNQWSDNISVIDVAALKVIDTLKTGNGPAGISLSADGKFLYVVNTFSSDISIIDLLKREEIKRLLSGSNPTGIERSPDGKSLIVTSRRAVIVPYGEPLECELTIINDSTQRVVEYKKVESAYLMENILSNAK